MEKDEIKEIISDGLTNDASQNFNQNLFLNFDEKKKDIQQQYFPKDESVLIGLIVAALIVIYFAFAKNSYAHLSDDPKFRDIYILFSVIVMIVIFFISLNQFTSFIIKQKSKK